MFKNYVIISFLLLSNLLVAQRGSMTVYLDSLGKKTDIKDHTFKRVIENAKLPQTYYPITDYYKSGEVYATGQINNIHLMAKQGSFTYFHPNGNKKLVVTYENGDQVGKKNSWYENGNRKLEGFYEKSSDGKLNSPTILKVYNYWNVDEVQTIIDGTGSYEDDSNTQYVKGFYKNGYRDGQWSGKDKILNYTYNESYDAGTFLGGVSIDSLNMEHPYDEITVQPDYPGGLQGFFTFVARNFRVPNVNGLSGRLLIQLNIGTDGKVSNIDVVRGIHPSADREAARVLQQSGPWIPGKIRGIPAEVKYSIPITIKPAGT